MRNWTIASVLAYSLAIAVTASGCAAEPAADSPGASPGDADETSAEASPGDADETSAEIDFTGKTLTIIASLGPGSIGDARDRAAALSLEKLLPGRPRVVVQNVTGGRGDRGLRQLADSRTPRDGTVVMDVHANQFVAELTGNPHPNYRAEEQLIGAIGAKTSGIALWVWKDIASSWDEVMALDSPLTIPESTRGPGTAPLVVLQELGAPLDVIFGHSDDSAQQEAAFLRHETDALFSSRTLDPELYDDIVPVVWFGDVPPLENERYRLFYEHTGITENPPHVFEAMDVPKAMQDAALTAFKVNDVHRGAFAVPPDTPVEIREFWERILAEVGEDPDYIASLVAAGEESGGTGYASRDEILSLAQTVRDLGPDEYELFVELMGDE